ncbi:MAG: hypothetical protein HDR88_00260 [Bacteroides sp.]|nr:hypothetical protein [Bacteroides sp.]
MEKENKEGLNKNIITVVSTAVGEVSGVLVTNSLSAKETKVNDASHNIKKDAEVVDFGKYIVRESISFVEDINGIDESLIESDADEVDVVDAAISAADYVSVESKTIDMVESSSEIDDIAGNEEIIIEHSYDNPSVDCGANYSDMPDYVNNADVDAFLS